MATHSARISAEVARRAGDCAEPLEASPGSSERIPIGAESKLC
ncbi:MAG: hypothetical protein RBU37_17705 [Myxococcota bacterium]|nr:hypothetical protein [Myxococcota bacterium]